jgi:uncharacterized protein (DUF58 family)
LLKKFITKLKINKKIKSSIFSAKLNLTTTGRYFSILSFLVGAAAVNAGINLLFVIFAMMLSSMLVSGFLLENTTKKIRISRKLPKRIHAKKDCLVIFTIENLKKKMPSFSLVFKDYIKGIKDFPPVYALKIQPKSTLELEYTIKFERRGFYTFPYTILMSRFPFGFFQKSMEMLCYSTAVVYPEVRTILQTSSLFNEYLLSKSRKKLLKEGTDIFHGIRDFRTGDNPKWIHWKTTAKMRKTMLKEYEMEDINKVLIILDTHIPEEQDKKLSESLEESIVLSASLSNYFMEQSCEVTLASYMPAFNVVKTSRKFEDLFDILHHLAMLNPTKDDNVEKIFEVIDRSILMQALKICIVLDADDKRKSRLQNIMKNYGISKVIAINEGQYKKLYSRGGSAYIKTAE